MVETLNNPIGHKNTIICEYLKKKKENEKVSILLREEVLSVLISLCIN